ncbi:ATP synthase alpha/beta chain, C terminal domain [Azotobacter beijerinckii]|uniref:ATP synthase alpha/beta chain, C terminal domain n=1 Tax=Azotobacter beijerinckii TaxID=170623 RepID=A0A1I1CJH1_9GAMM|nr:ATP synthase alpha/beta chain, C terminal domain [Azotobacter beijerinckii]
MDVGLSVSRVGGKAQPKALREVAGRLRLEYSQFLELEMFTRFGGLSDSRVRGQIARGERSRALLAQPRFAALRLVDQVALLAALGGGVLDAYPPTLIGRLRARLPAWLDARTAALVQAARQGGELDATAQGVLAEQVAALCRELAGGAA